MVKFQPSFSFWPRPQFFTGSKSSFARWINRDAALQDRRDTSRGRAIRQIIEDHHDRNARTIVPAPRAD